MSNLVKTPERLKQSILQKAMQGKLTKQLPSDGDVDYLLQLIQQKKQQLINKQKIHKYHKLIKINDNKIIYKTPKNWQWTILNDISIWQSGGSTPKKSNRNNYQGNIPWIKGGDLKDNYINHTINNISHSAMINSHLHLHKPGTIIMARAGNVSKLGILNVNATYNDQCFSCWPLLLNHEFVFWYLLSQRKNLISLSSGSAQHSLAINKVRNYPIPVPPLSEQHRIVQRLNEILPKIDDLNKDVIKLDSIRTKFPHRLKQSLLLEAMKGHLTQQLPSDGNADDLLQSIQQKKQQLIQAGKIRKHKKLPPISKDEIPFKIPRNWEWVRLNSICLGIVDGTHNPPKNSGKGVPIISARNITNNGINFNLSNRFITKIQFLKEDKRTHIRNNDVLLSIVGSIGKTCVVYTNTKFTAQRSVSVLHSDINSVFLMYLLKSYVSKIYFNKNSSGTAQKGIYLTQLRKMPIPLPPLSEQHRIVNKLSKIFKIIDD